MTNVRIYKILDGLLITILRNRRTLKTEKQEESMPIDWRDHIVSTPEVLRGKPRIKGTRIPVSLILGYLAAGTTPEGIIGEFPDLTKEQIAACLDYARALSEFEVAVSWASGSLQTLVSLILLFIIQGFTMDRSPGNRW